MSLRNKLLLPIVAIILIMAGPTAITGALAEGARGEPAFCQLAAFKRLEVPYNSSPAPLNVHMFKLGQVNLIGSAVGDSPVADEKRLVRSLSRASEQERHCTWYLNDGNAEARESFNWHYVPKPKGTDYADMVARYLDVLGDQFDRSSVSFLSCAEQFGIVSVGCDGMKHRGPTVFAMVLGYAGCAPEHAAAIATYYWGENGIEQEMRVQLARAAGRIAADHPAESARFRALIGAR